MHLQKEINLIQAKCLKDNEYKNSLSRHLKTTYNGFIKTGSIRHKFFNGLFKNTIKLLNHKNGERTFKSLLHYIDPSILYNYFKFLIDSEKAKKIVDYLYKSFDMVR